MWIPLKNFHCGLFTLMFALKNAGTLAIIESFSAESNV
jgi:hypothetical protein